MDSLSDHPNPRARKSWNKCERKEILCRILSLLKMCKAVSTSAGSICIQRCWQRWYNSKTLCARWVEKTWDRCEVLDSMPNHLFSSLFFSPGWPRPRSVHCKNLQTAPQAVAENCPAPHPNHRQSSPTNLRSRHRRRHHHHLDVDGPMYPVSIRICKCDFIRSFTLRIIC